MAADVALFMVSGELFGWLPVRDVITFAFLVGALVLLLDAERKVRSGVLYPWAVVVSLWAVAIGLDSFRRIGGLDALHPAQRAVELAAVLTMVRAAYSAHKSRGLV